jgi:hypothetical protein
MLLRCHCDHLNLVVAFQCPKDELLLAQSSSRKLLTLKDTNDSFFNLELTTGYFEQDLADAHAAGTFRIEMKNKGTRIDPWGILISHSAMDGF